MRDVKDIRQQMGYHSLEWNGRKKPRTDLFGQELLMDPSCFNFLLIGYYLLVNHFPLLLFRFSPGL